MGIGLVPGYDQHRHLGRGAPDPLPHRAGHRRRRRVGRCRADGRRVDRPQATRVHDQLRAARRAGRHGAGQRRARRSCRSSPTSEDFLDWGWRVPFLLSAVLVFVGLYIRQRRRRDAGVREAAGGGARREDAGAAGGQGALARADPDGAAAQRPADALLHLHHLRPDLRHADAGAEPQPGAGLRDGAGHHLDDRHPLLRTPLGQDRAPHASPRSAAC